MLDDLTKERIEQEEKIISKRGAKMPKENKEIYNFNNTSILKELKNELLNSFIAWIKSNYDGLPDDVPFWQIGKLMFYNGQAMWFNIEGVNFVLPIAKGGKLNDNGILVEGEPITVSGNKFPKFQFADSYEYKDGHITKHKQNAVWIRCNFETIPIWNFLEPYLQRLDYAWQTIGIEEAGVRTKRIILCQEGQKNIVKREIKKAINDGEPYIIITAKQGSDLANIGEMQRTTDPVVIKDLWYDFDKVWTQVLKRFGLEHMGDTDKKEHQNDSEINKGDEENKFFADSMLMFLDDAFNQVNKLFGTNIQRHKEEKEDEEEEDEEDNDTNEKEDE